MTTLQLLYDRIKKINYLLVARTRGRPLPYETVYLVNELNILVTSFEISKKSTQPTSLLFLYEHQLLATTLFLDLPEKTIPRHYICVSFYGLVVKNNKCDQTTSNNTKYTLHLYTPIHQTLPLICLYIIRVFILVSKIIGSCNFTTSFKIIGWFKLNTKNVYEILLSLQVSVNESILYSWRQHTLQLATTYWYDQYLWVVLNINSSFFYTSQ